MSVFCYMRSLSDAPPFLSFFYNFFWLEDFGNEVISTTIVLDNEALGDAINSTDPGGILTGPSCVSITQRGIMNSQKYLFAATPSCWSLVSKLVEPLFPFRIKKETGAKYPIDFHQSNLESKVFLQWKTAAFSCKTI